MTNTTRTGVASKIAAHLDVGTVVTAVVGFLMAGLVNTAVDKLDKLGDGVAALNEKMVMVLTRGDYHDKKDTLQDDRLLRHQERLQKLEERVTRIER